jgi:hypothetical protein
MFSNKEASSSSLLSLAGGNSAGAEARRSIGARGGKSWFTTSSSCSDERSGGDGADSRSIDGTGDCELSPAPPACSSSPCSESEVASLCFFVEGGVGEVLLPSRVFPDDGCTLKGAKTLFNCSEPKGTLVPVLFRSWRRILC